MLAHVGCGDCFLLNVLDNRGKRNNTANLQETTNINSVSFISYLVQPFNRQLKVL